MYVTYFDEVKANPQHGQDRYWVGGICVPMAAIAEIEGTLNAIAQDVFGSTELVPDTEFHAAFIYSGKGPYKGWPPERRISLLARLAEVFRHDKVRRVYAAIDTKKLHNAERAPDFAFAHFCERVQMLIGKHAVSMLIGDLDADQYTNMVRDYSRYRANGTPWAYGIPVTSLVDGVHFARSHHSRMVQLADVYMFLATHPGGPRKGWMAEALTKAINGIELYPHRYKDWPKD